MNTNQEEIMELGVFEPNFHRRESEVAETAAEKTEIRTLLM
jgi:hypothetical protein